MIMRELGVVHPMRKQPRIAGLDTLRFLAALWVVFGHCGNPPLEHLIASPHFVGRAVHAAVGNIFGPVPAVIVFFLISGFCIHYPYRSPGTFEVAPYLARRCLRIGIPLVVAIVLANPLQVNLSLFQKSVLWSLVAELIFYSLYPILRILHAQFGWNKIILASYAASVAVVAIFTPTAKDYGASGIGLTWIICLPYWLLGCRLAEEKFDPSATVSISGLWCWRAAVLAAAAGFNLLRFHSGVGYPWTMGLFAALLYFWLRLEIIAFFSRKPIRALEWGGKWSYSIYLTHLIAFALFARVHSPDLGYFGNWIEMIGFILLFAYVFYLVVERPGHGFARWMAKVVRKKPKVVVASSPELTLPGEPVRARVQSSD
jgi:peptidoglycan/LPS O-acetylase OafA/YrhL